MSKEHNSEVSTNNDESCSSNENPPSKRKRGLTSLTLEWLAERFRKMERIKNQIAEGKYDVSTEKVARSLAEKEHSH